MLDYTLEHLFRLFACKDFSLKLDSSVMDADGDLLRFLTHGRMCRIRRTLETYFNWSIVGSTTS